MPERKTESVFLDYDKSSTRMDVLCTLIAYSLFVFAVKLDFRGYTVDVIRSAVYSL